MLSSTVFSHVNSGLICTSTIQGNKVVKYYVLFKEWVLALLYYGLSETCSYSRGDATVTCKYSFQSTYYNVVKMLLIVSENGSLYCDKNRKISIEIIFNCQYTSLGYSRFSPCPSLSLAYQPLEG